MNSTNPISRESLCGYFINLDHREDREQAIRENLHKSGFAGRIERLSAIRGEVAKDPVINGRIGCVLSHRLAISQAAEKNLEAVLILEDDAVFVEDRLKFLDRALLSLSGRNWDILYFGYNAVGPVKREGDCMCRLTHPLTTHAMVVHSRIYDQILSDLPASQEECLEWLSTHKAIDVYYGFDLTPKKNVFGVYPPVAFQEEDYSDIQHGSSAELDFERYRRASGALRWCFHKVYWNAVGSLHHWLKGRVHRVRKRNKYARR